MRWRWRRVARSEDGSGRSSEVVGQSHSALPLPGKLGGEDVEAALASLDPGDLTAIQDLGEQLRGKVVANSIGGHSGYMLRFGDGAWLVVWLDSACPEWRL